MISRRMLLAALLGTLACFAYGQEAAQAANTTAVDSTAAKVDPAPVVTPAPVPEAKAVDVTTVQEISFAPAAQVANHDDIDPTGNCLPEVKKYCADVTVGEGHIADCVSDLITEAEVSDAETDAEPVEVSDACREEVFQYKIGRNSNINKNIPLAKACKVDAEKHCNITWFFGYKSGQIISCLREIKEQLAPACGKQIFKLQIDAATDFRSDPQLYESCKDDAETLCQGIKFGGGRVQACLRDKRMQLSWACEEQLFRQELEDSDDIRLSVRLYTRCIREKRKFCAEVEPGSAKVKDCLETHRKDEGFGSDCREQVDLMVEQRVRDFRLDSRLRTTCESDIYNMCAFFGDVDTLDTEDTSVIRCLQDYMNEITSAPCRSLVRKYKELASEDIRFDVPLAEACYEDRQRLCATVPPVSEELDVGQGSARVIRCLTNGRDKLSALCRATLFDEEVRFSENIDFQYPMKVACMKELDLYCKDVPHGEARAIRCLQDHQEETDFSKDCKKQVEQYELEATSDYRLNFRLSKACQEEIQSLCGSTCAAEGGSTCGGTVLRCLTEKKDEIKSETCTKEVLYFEKMEVSNFNNDVLLAAACRGDVEKFCASVQSAGEGRVHECLRSHRTELSDTCRREELLLEEHEADTVELRPGLLRICRAERRAFCGTVDPGEARVFRCLAEKLSDPDFGDACRKEIVDKLQRRQANWKLDPILRKSCRAAVAELCTAEDAANSEEGLVYKCLANHYFDVDQVCQKELGRAVHMAFYVWQQGAVLTADCDADVKKLCLDERPNMASTPGAVGTCLAGKLEESTKSGVSLLADKCHALVDVAEPPNMKVAFDASLTVALLQSQLVAVEQSTGLTMLTRDTQGNAQALTLTGWTALLGIASMVVLVLFGANYGYRQYRGVPDQAGYTLVVKGKGGR
ncbi:Golgi apparatus protein 1 [Tetrabaena socialis]|uniref:Golgi apparatus protein 1 n=1 Tax=Tetrabaena socialis TaxID=47790 RepID=A0A2J8ABP9_9CHLO|nr:Golgi apparatus protein 1 [Tetrabaena socialis]|eukprot:PNH09949.1 Golgi apparatus protein 1 [Tetrabaena socialis]